MSHPQLGEYRYPYPAVKNHKSKLFTKNGMIISVEGLDGAGKSTFVKQLEERLCKENKVYTGNFIHSPWLKDSLLQFKYNNCDEYSFTLLYTMALSRFFTEEIAPKLDEGYVVVLDRYILTIFSKGVVRGVDDKWLRGVLSVFREADVQIFIDTDMDLCLKRKCSSDKILSYWECGCMLSKDDSLRMGYDAAKYKENFILYQKSIREILISEMNPSCIVLRYDDFVEMKEQLDYVMKQISIKLAR